MGGIGVALTSTFNFGTLKLGSEGADKMDWDYRVVFVPYEEGSDEGEYTIREVYYDSEGEITSWSDEAAQFTGYDFWDFADDFDHIAEAFDKPVLVLIDEELVEDDSEEDEEEE